MRVGILHHEPYYRLPEGRSWSARIRARWLWENWPEAQPYVRGSLYDAILFNPQCAGACRAATGRPLRILDVCNPEWEDPRAFGFALRLCHAVSCSSPQLAAHVAGLTGRPVFHIADRLDLAKYPLQKEHAGAAKKAAWFGYSNGQEALVPLVPAVLERGLRLTVISEDFRRDLFGDRADEIHFEPYHHETFEKALLEHADIALNPRLDTGRFPYKSNNRILTAWALGLPVAEHAADLDRFLREEARAEEAALRGPELREKWDIRLSIEEHRNLIHQLLEARA